MAVPKCFSKSSIPMGTASSPHRRFRGTSQVLRGPPRIGDTNKDGVLSREEFEAAMQKAEKPVTDISKTPVVGGGTGALKLKRIPLGSSKCSTRTRTAS